MATIKQEKTRLAKREASTDEVKELLTHIPNVAPNVVPTAADALMDAADDYRDSQPIVDPEGRRSKPNLAEARASLVALHKHLAKAQEQLSNLPLDAMTAIAQVTDVPEERMCSYIEQDGKAPVGKMRSDITQASETVEKALSELSARPHKIADSDRRVLAYQVAVVFRDILKVKPTSTSDMQLTANMTTARGGAAYARVLRATLKAAGVVDYNQGPLIEAGLALLKDPNLPSTK